MTIALVAVTIWLSRRRRRTLIELGIGAAIALTLTYVIAKRGSAAIVDGLHSGSTVTVLRGVIDSSLTPLTTLTIWIVVIGVVVAVAAWLSGRHDVRVAVVTASKRVGRAAGEAHDADSPITLWIARYSSWLRIAGVVAGLLLLLVATSSWFAIVLWIVVVLVYEGVISFLIGEWPFGPGAEEGDPAA